MLRIAAAFLTLALSMASAKSYAVNLFQAVVIAGTELQPGEYTLNVDGDRIVMKRGKVSVEAKVRITTVETKNRSTSLTCNEANGKYQVREINLQGTNTKLVLD